MKDGDYINILAPMKSKLKLKGNALMLFALIHGYSKDGKIITKEVAMDKIKKLGLVEVCRNKHGVIWDSPDEPMLRKYEGTFSHLK